MANTIKMVKDVASIADIFIAYAAKPLDSKICKFMFYVVSMLIGSLLYELFNIDARGMMLFILWITPLLWLLFDIFTP